MPTLRRIAHIDMDAFYASVELLRYPQLRDQPVVIGGSRRRLGQPDPAAGEFTRLSDYTGRGVVTTATYPAREFGVHSGMGLMKAAKLCPQAILLPVDFDEYRRYSRLFKSAVIEIAAQMEDRGIDEVYADFSDVPDGQLDGGRVVAQRLQQLILERTGLTCSIGVAPNKLIAKMASEFNKPRGICIVFETDLRTAIWPLPCRKIHGVGPKAAARLSELGIQTIGELAQCELGWLQRHFGTHHGHWLHDAAWGRDDRPVVVESEPVSLSRETTFERDLHARLDRAELRALFTTLCNQVAADLARKGYAGRTVSIKLRYDNFQRLTRDQTLPAPTADAATIRRAAGQCLRRAPLDRRLRLLGVRVAGLVRLDAAAAAARSPDTPAPMTLDLF
jgi:DNA polymerase IV